MTQTYIREVADELAALNRTGELDSEIRRRVLAITEYNTRAFKAIRSRSCTLAILREDGREIGCLQKADIYTISDSPQTIDVDHLTAGMYRTAERVRQGIESFCVMLSSWKKDDVRKRFPAVTGVFTAVDARLKETERRRLDDWKEHVTQVREFMDFLTSKGF